MSDCIHENIVKQWNEDEIRNGRYELVCKMMNANCNSKDRFVLNYSL